MAVVVWVAVVVVAVAVAGEVEAVGVLSGMAVAFGLSTRVLVVAAGASPAPTGTLLQSTLRVDALRSRFSAGGSHALLG